MVQDCVCFLIQTLRLEAMNLLTEGRGAGAWSLAGMVGVGIFRGCPQELVAVPGESGEVKTLTSMVYQHEVQEQESTGQHRDVPRDTTRT